VIVLKGKKHALKPLSVNDVIENGRAAERLEKATSETEQFEILIDMLARSFPTMEREAWAEMSVEQLQAVFQCAQEVGREANEQAAEAASGNAA